MQGRITEADLKNAELSFPGISSMYWQLPEKPPTFLQLVWLYERAMLALQRRNDCDSQCHSTLN
ncbi:MAG: hypothetical protein AAGC55_17575 [Myxococcota bacterium]